MKECKLSVCPCEFCKEAASGMKFVKTGEIRKPVLNVDWHIRGSDNKITFAVNEFNCDSPAVILRAVPITEAPAPESE